MFLKLVKAIVKFNVFLRKKIKSVLVRWELSAIFSLLALLCFFICLPGYIAKQIRDINLTILSSLPIFLILGNMILDMISQLILFNSNQLPKSEI